MVEFTREGLLAIKAEINTDPLALGYSGKTDGQIAALLNEPRTSLAVQGPIPAGQFAYYVLKVGKSAALATSTNETIKNLMPFLVSGGGGDILATDAAGILDTMVAGGVLVAADKAAILALGLGPSRSRAEQVWGTSINTDDVTMARATV
jgi:hypothetical protein